MSNENPIIQKEVMNKRKNYKFLHSRELKRRKYAESKLQEKNNELAELKLLIKEKEKEIENIKALSYTNSQTAKNGYKEEELVCNDLNNNKLIKEAFKPMSGSDTAKSGFKAEEIFRTDANIKNSLEKHFKKSIKKIIKAPHGEKYDNIIIFEDESNYKIQNKKFLNFGGRGDSFDRRHIKKTFNNRYIRKYLTRLTLDRRTKRTTSMSKEQKEDFISLCNKNLDDIKQYLKKTLIGTDENKNEYWCFMKTDKDLSKKQLHLIESEKLYNFLEKNINIDIKLRNNGTRLHLSKYIALQRKGGGKTDHAPNHIQAKLTITKDLLDMCDQIL